MKVKFNQRECDIKVEFYEDNLCCRLRLVDYEGPVATATVNPPSRYGLDIDEVAIKTWSENEGIVESLVEAGAIEDTGESLPVGRVFARICKLKGVVKEEFLNKRKLMKAMNLGRMYR